MLHLAKLLYSLISTTLAGTAVIAALVTGHGTLVPILIAAAIGFVVAVPVTWVVVRAMTGR
ncbi:CTP synthetase [Escherichia coli]|nr:CTP synthetase [Escherichia coli]